jgi:hypothetical protein
MKTLRLTTDPTIRRLRWLMVLVILADGTATALGQGRGFWSGSRSVDEANDFVAPILRHGPSSFAVFVSIYVIAAFLLVSSLPRRLAIAALFAYVFGHYAGASSWLVYEYNFGVKSAVAYAVLLAIAVSLLAFDTGITSASKKDA